MKQIKILSLMFSELMFIKNKTMWRIVTKGAICALVILLVLEVAGANTYNDEFTSTSLDPKWTFVDPLADCSYNLSNNPGYLRIFVPGDNHNLYPGNYNAPRVIQSINGDFVIETRVLFDPIFNAQGAGILIWKDSNNFLRFERILHRGTQEIDLNGVRSGS